MLKITSLDQQWIFSFYPIKSNMWHLLLELIIKGVDRAAQWQQKRPGIIRSSLKWVRVTESQQVSQTASRWRLVQQRSSLFLFDVISEILLSKTAPVWVCRGFFFFSFPVLPTSFWILIKRRRRCNFNRMIQEEVTSLCVWVSVCVHFLYVVSQGLHGEMSACVWLCGQIVNKQTWFTKDFKCWNALSHCSHLLPFFNKFIPAPIVCTTTSFLCLECALLFDTDLWCLC